jgi:hypothetical protein
VAIFGAGDGTRRLIPLTWNPGPVELVWGPEGSRFVIVRGEEGRFISYIAVDLMRGESLREEHLNFGSLSSIPQVPPPDSFDPPLSQRIRWRKW